MSRYLRAYSGVRAISNKSNESNEYERTRIKVRSFVANGYSLRIASCSDDSFDIRPCSLIIYSNGLKFGRFIRCPSLLILEPLEKVSSDLANPLVVVVVDALDECEREEDVKVIIDLLSQAKSLKTIHLRFFVTSRPDLPIRLGFNNISGKYEDLVLHQIPEPVVEH